MEKFTDPPQAPFLQNTAWRKSANSRKTTAFRKTAQSTTFSAVATYLAKKALTHARGSTSRVRASSSMNCMTIVWCATCAIRSCFCQETCAMDSVLLRMSKHGNEAQYARGHWIQLLRVQKWGSTIPDGNPWKTGRPHRNHLWHPKL